MASKKKFGSMAKCVVKYAIAVFVSDVKEIKKSGKRAIKFVSKVSTYPKKVCEWNDGEKAFFFESREYAEDVCFGLNANGTSCFVMEVPDFFNYDDFINPKK